VLRHGHGDYVFDDAERRYLDFVQGWAVNALGHSPLQVRQALAAQSKKLVHGSAGFFNEAQLALADALCARTGFARAITFCSGAEANESAIKLARTVGARRGAGTIITTLNSFHGRTLATMSASGKASFAALFEPKVAGFRKVPYGDIEAMEAALDNDVAAVMLEPIQGEAGVVVPPPAYLPAVRALTRARGILLIADEVQTGMGRTGSLLACEKAGIQADIVTLGKGLGAGVPVSAMLCNAELDCFSPGEQGGTHTGHPLLSAVALAVLEVVSTPAFLADVLAKGARVAAILTQIAAALPHAEVRGQGLLWALVLGETCAQEVADEARSLGLLVNAPQSNVLRFMPALNVEDAAISAFGALLRDAIARVPRLRLSQI
jgi:acetylornithine/N-succinyldiaminopimelate aminotransferase